MIRFAITLATLILVAGFGLSGYALTQVMIANFSLEGRISWVAVAQSVSPFILAAGVLVAWAALQSNIRHSHEQRRREESAFFFRECKENFDEIISLLTITLADDSELRYGTARATFKQDLEHIAAVLNDIRELATSIVEESFARAYQRRRDDVKRRLYNLFKHITLEDLTQLRWTNGDDIESRIAQHGAAIGQKLSKEVNPAKQAELREQLRQKDESTPFPEGVPTRTIRTILDFFDANQAKTCEPKALDPRLDILRYYMDLCHRYENVEGQLRPKHPTEPQHESFPTLPAINA